MTASNTGETRDAEQSERTRRWNLPQLDVVQQLATVRKRSDFNASDRGSAQYTNETSGHEPSANESIE